MPTLRLWRPICSTMKFRPDAPVALARDGVEVLADEFSLRERGITPDRLTPGISPVALDVVIDRLADGWKVLWH